jgi:hypothetical protein
MKARIFATAAVLSAFSTSLPAVDSQLLGLVMPDAKVLAGVNVAQAKGSPFGQYVLSQISGTDPELQQLTTLTGFDPRQDLTEVLVASTGGPGSHTGLAAATGNFNVGTIMALASTKGAATEKIGDVTILEDPGKTHGVAFLSGSLVVAGDVADVKDAIARVNNPSMLPTAVVNQVQSLSGSQDAWGLSTVPLTNLGMSAGKNSPLPLGNGLENSLGSVQSIGGGVKFGATVSFSLQAQTDTAQNATSLAGVVQFLANMAQMQANKNPQAVAALQSLTATATGTTVSVSMSMPEDQFQQLLKPQTMSNPHRPAKK